MRRVTIEPVRGRLDEKLGDRLLAFWAEHGVLPDGARERLAEVTCVLLDGDGEVAGVNSVYPDSVAALGGRRFWVYRQFLAPGREGDSKGMIEAAFAELAKAFDGADGDPIGLCVFLPPALAAEHPEAVWPSGLLHAAVGQDGAQVRVGYFENAVIAPGVPDSPTLADRRSATFPLAEGLEVVPFGEPGAGRDDVMAFWAGEGAVTEGAMENRADEVIFAGVERGERVVAASTAYAEQNERLGMEMWHVRVGVGSEHRRSSLAIHLAIRGRELLAERFAAGQGPPGIVYEVENVGLRTHHNQARWLHTDFTFIGLNRAGAHLRVHYFAGATVSAVDG
jgi:hypothetical protein